MFNPYISRASTVFLFHHVIFFFASGTTAEEPRVQNIRWSDLSKYLMIQFILLILCDTLEWPALFLFHMDLFAYEKKATSIFITMKRRSRKKQPVNQFTHIQIHTRESIYIMYLNTTREIKSDR